MSIADEVRRRELAEANKDDFDVDSAMPVTPAVIARKIRRELVCCDVYDRDAGTERAGRTHSICFWGEAAARIAERPDEWLDDDPASATYVDRCVEQWRVVDARGETSSISTDPEVARRVAECLDGSSIWYRQIRTVRQEWRLLETIKLPSTVEDIR